MSNESIHRVDYMNLKKKTDFEITDLKQFFIKRDHKQLERDFRLNFWLVFYVTKGTGRHYVDFNGYDYKNGDIIFIQKNQVNRFEVNDQVEGYLMHINEPFFYRMEGFNGDIFLEFADKAYGSPVMSVDNSIDTTNRALVELIFKEYNRGLDELNIELIASLFQGFILSLRGLQGNDDENIFHSKDYENFKLYRRLVEENYMNTRNVEDYAAMMHLSKKTVNQATRKVSGLSAKQFIINRLILEIKRYLSQGELMNYEIADLLGFGDAANMTKFFKHYEGVSPKEFRRYTEEAI